MNSSTWLGKIRSWRVNFRVVAAALPAAVLGGFLAGSYAPAISSAASSGTGLSTSPTLASIKSAGVMRDCIDPEFRPEIYLNAQNQPAGLDVALAQALALNIGVKIQFVQTTFDGLIAGLEAGKCDISISGITPRGTRALAVSFAKPTVEAGETLLVPALLTKTTLAQMNSATVNFCVQEGTGSQTDTQKYFPKAKETALTSAQNCILQVLSGRSQAFLTDTITASGAVAAHPTLLKTLLPKGVVLPSAPTAAAVPLGDLGFVAYINTFFGEFINNGLYQPVCIQYLGPTACDQAALLAQRGNF